MRSRLAAYIRALKTEIANPTATPVTGPMGVWFLKLLDQHGKEMSFGGGLAGAERNTREMANWLPDMRPPDVRFGPDKDLLDARAQDRIGSDGFVQGAVDITKDSIVGAVYVCNARPNALALGAPGGPKNSSSPPRPSSTC